MKLQLATESGLTWRTIRRYAKSELLERADDDQPIYMHSAKCPSFCDYSCNGAHGDKIAADVAHDECYEPAGEQP